MPLRSDAAELRTISSELQIRLKDCNWNDTIGFGVVGEPVVWTLRINPTYAFRGSLTNQRFGMEPIAVAAHVGLLTIKIKHAEMT